MDTIDSLRVLTEHGLHCTRSKYVDSAEDAVAFAERRNARDARLIPIALRIDVAGAPMNADAQLMHDETNIRRAYESANREARARGGRVLAQALPEDGTSVAVAGVQEHDRKSIEVSAGEQRALGAVPLQEDRAFALADGLRAHHHPERRDHVHRMIAHVLSRLSDFFESPDVAGFGLTLCLHDNGYTILDASISASKPLSEHRRLDSRAHDRKGDEFHPSGRQ